MHKDVLSVRRAIAQASEKLEDFGMNVGDAEGERGGFTFLEEFLIELLSHFVDKLFDARRMDAAVLHESLERDARDLAADWIEAGEDDRFRRVVDDEIEAGGRFGR